REAAGNNRRCLRQVVAWCATPEQVRGLGKGCSELAPTARNIVAEQLFEPMPISHQDPFASWLRQNDHASGSLYRRRHKDRPNCRPTCHVEVLPPSRLLQRIETIVTGRSQSRLGLA